MENKDILRGRNMQKKFLISVLISVLFFNCSVTFAVAGPWKGRIIDIETKEPLEGAVVVAFWSRVWRTPAGNVASVYEGKEVLTDREGRFEMPSYTPINLLPLITFMKGPEFIIFKPGYGSLQMVLDRYLTGNDETKKVEPYGGQLNGYMIRISKGLIELQKLKTREERLRASMVGATGYHAKDLPLLYKAINEEERYLGIPERE